MKYQAIYSSPIGKILLTSSDVALTGLDFIEEEVYNSIKNAEKLQNTSLILKDAAKELDEYFHGKRVGFEIPINQSGTTFQLSVWGALRTIPYGFVKSYQDIATAIGNPKAVRAVGMTNGKNPIAVIVPCHRVIGKNGKMVGYSSGIWRKEWLLAHEKKVLGN